MFQDFENHLRSNDRVLVLKPREGKPKGTNGLVDSRLFTGKNKLHAMMEPESSLWKFKYDEGILPEPLKQKFTSFRLMYEHAKDYFDRRNIDIEEVKD